MRITGTARAVRAAGRAAAVAGLATLGLSVTPGAVPGAVAAVAGAAVTPAEVPAPGVPVSARFVSPPRAVPLSSGLRQACATPAHPGQMACDALVPAAPASSPARASEPPSYAYSPADLQSAYALTSASATGGKGVTVAIVDAFNDPHAASDLAVYRSHYKLPACTQAKGCLRVVNQTGGSKLPGTDSTGGWELDESLDLDVVSAICPNCRILLVESSSASIANLARAEKYAVAHARVVSDSWGSGTEFTSEASFDPDFNHPGVAIAASAGNTGYGTQYPASSQYVTAVGGTTLRRDASTARGWTEQVWSGTGSGCSSIEAAAPWAQPAVPAGCQNRTETDVSADADPNTPAAVYDTVKRNGNVLDWTAPAGDSLATSLVASTYALAATVAGGTYPRPRTYAASYPYAHRADFFAVTSGSNGSCEAARAYLCHGRAGYDGPTGLGTPDGVAGFAPVPATTVTVLDPGTQDAERGAQLTLRLTARDGAPGGSVAFTSSALPAGLRLSAGGVISGRPSVDGSTTVRVTAKDRATGASGSVSFPIVVLARLADPHPGAGPLRLNSLRTCLAGAGSYAVISACHAAATAQQWQYVPAGDPGGAGQLKLGGRCLGSSGSGVVLGTCTGGSSQWWALRSGGRVVNPRSGRCLNDPGNSTSAGTRAGVLACDGNFGQFWTLPAAPVISGIPGMCLTDPGSSSASGTRITISGCTSAAAQKWVLSPGASSLQIRGKCLTVASGSKQDGAAVELRGCSGDLQQTWLKGPRGEVLNANSGRCLAVPAGSAGSGTKLVQDDCTGSRGEIWAIS